MKIITEKKFITRINETTQIRDMNVMQSIGRKIQPDCAYKHPTAIINTPRLADGQIRYSAYLKSGCDRSFYDVNATEINLRETTKKFSTNRTMEKTLSRYQ